MAPLPTPRALPSPEEAGRYLETYKAYEQKPPDLLKERVEQDFLSRVSYAPSLPPTTIWGPWGPRGSPDPHPGHLQMTDCLTSIKSVNKTDALSLLTTFGVRQPWGCHSPWGTLGTGDASLKPSPTPQDPHLTPKPLTLLPIPQSLAAVVDASREDLSLCPGVGPQKVSDGGTWGMLVPHPPACLTTLPVSMCVPPLLLQAKRLFDVLHEPFLKVPK